jgi:hypothetical protein
MLALSYASHTASTAWHHHAERMPACQPMFASCMCMGAATASAASSIIIGTDVNTSVSLFVVVLLVCSLLLVSLVILSLLLTGLTGLISLEGLVGHGIGLSTGKTQGD